ncbi:MAG TPA: hypothetical protein VEJ68_03505 [Candidatus Bathyarchaeia archaeon]|nr:hypothetical protein [Candidatus Bathyarchaeia archaeon]
MNKEKKKKNEEFLDDDVENDENAEEYLDDEFEDDNTTNKST